MSATIVIATGRDWFGDPRLGTFTVYLDGKKAGKLPPRGRLVLTCQSGKHVARIRQWWYLSPRVEVDVGEATSLVLDADVTHRGSMARRALTMMFAPWRGLSLAVVPDVEPYSTESAGSHLAGCRHRGWCGRASARS
jgi:hypothetical protein